ncbi:MAG: CBS domain-containing protein [Aestuariivirga sp.]
MRARDIMTASVVTVSPETDIAEAVKLMLDRQISGVPVIDASGRLIGILTEGDLMRRAELVTGRQSWWINPISSPEQEAKAYVKAHGLKVKDVMTKEVVTINEQEPLDRIAMLFEERGIKRTPVLRGGKVVGIVSRANLLRSLAAKKITDPAPSDSQIRSAILATAAEDAAIRVVLVDVTVDDGVVHLWGNTASEAERDAFRVVAENTKGVKEVQNHIRVLPRSNVDYKLE